MEKKIRIPLAILILGSIVLLCGLCSAGSGEYMDLRWKYLGEGAVVFVHVDDLDNDGFKEVIVAASKETMIGACGWIYVLDRDGNLKWKYDLPGALSPIVIEDMNGDGKKDIIVGVFSYVHVIDSSGDEIWKRHIPDIQRPRVTALFMDDLDNDGSKEIIVGTSSKTSGKVFVFDENRTQKWVKKTQGGVNVLYAADLYKSGSKEVIAGTVGSYGVLNYPGYIHVFDATGNEVWKYQTKKGILSLSVDDINDDGRDEILVGCHEYFYVLDNHGGEVGNSTTGGRIRSMLVVDLENDGDTEIILGSNDVYVLDLNFQRKWINAVGSEVYDLDVFDLDGDGNMEVIVASDKLYVLDKMGKERWQYATAARVSVRSVCTSDLDDNDYPELIAGSVDKNVYVFHSMTYVKRQDADRYYTRAREFYSSGNYVDARKNTGDAKEIYLELGDSGKVKECEELLERIANSETQVNKEKERAEDYYKKAHSAYLSGEYENATGYAQKAKYIYLSFGDTEKVERCKEIIDGSVEFMRLDAANYLENASEYLEEGDYENALLYAQRAREFYEFIKDDEAVNKSEDLIARINKSTAKIVEKKLQFQFQGDLITPLLVGLIILAFIILAVLLIKRVKQGSGEEPGAGGVIGGHKADVVEPKVEVQKAEVHRTDGHKTEVKKEEMKEGERKEEERKEEEMKEGEMKREEITPTGKKTVKRRPVSKIGRERSTGLGSSLKGLIRNNELKEV